MAIEQVTVHFERKIAPFFNGVHCFVGKMNLVMVIFYYTWICVSIRDSIAKLIHFLYSKVEVLWISKAWDLIKTKGNKLLRKINQNLTNLHALYQNGYMQNITFSMWKCMLRLQRMKLFWWTWMVYIMLSSFMGPYISFLCLNACTCW
jgi:hypothetical protein